MCGDPVGFASGGPAYFNRYVYVANNPLNATDPTGEIINFIVGAAVGAGVGYAVDVVAQMATAEGVGSLSERWAAVDQGRAGRAAAVGAASGALGPGAAVVARGLGASAGTATAVGATVDTIGQPILGAVATELVTGDSTLQENAVGAMSGHAGRNAGQLTDTFFDALPDGGGGSVSKRQVLGRVLRAAGVTAAGALGATAFDETVTEEQTASSEEHIELHEEEDHYQ